MPRKEEGKKFPFNEDIPDFTLANYEQQGYLYPSMYVVRVKRPFIKWCPQSAQSLTLLGPKRVLKLF